MPAPAMTVTQRFALGTALIALVAVWPGRATAAGPGAATPAGLVVSLEGTWSLATDPQNVGREQQWWEKPTTGARPAKVPWIIQDAFPGYHGVAWYWRDFTAPANPHRGGRYLLRFWAVDYQAEVWLGGTKVGQHEDGESPFVLDVTGQVRPGAANRLAVRVLNPTDSPIDGIVLAQVPHRNKVNHYGAGSSYNHGGIVDSVELLAVAAVRAEDLFARADPDSGVIRVQANVRNAGAKPAAGQIELTVAPADSGQTLVAAVLTRDLPVGDTLVQTELKLDHPRRWELNDPYLYRVTVRVTSEGSPSVDESSVRCGFRELKFEKGCFRLNGRRIFLRCSHTGNHCPIGLQLPHDPDLLRRDLLNCKVMGFNTIRFIAGVATRYQLDLCDEIGLMVYEEPYAAWCLADSPKMPQRYDASLLGMVRRDRNHPSVTIWGLLNETSDGPVFRHAVSALPALRALDDSRLVLLNSGRWDRRSGGTAAVDIWRGPATDPCVTFNPSDRTIRALGVTWRPRQLAFHPGGGGQYGAVRWTAPAAGKVQIAAAFRGIAERATTDVHLMHNGRSLLEQGINVGGGNEASYRGTVEVKPGDTIDAAVGMGNGNYGGDSTGLALTIKTAGGKTYDAAADFSIEKNPAGPWSYGQMAPGAAPKSAMFSLFREKQTAGQTPPSIGSLSNPGSAVWEDVMDDQHPYQRVPHTASVIRTLRTIGDADQPLFLSEYGIGSGVDLVRVVRHYEQLGKANLEDAQFYRTQRDRFLADFERWKMAEAFGRPEEFFAQSLRKMAAQRLLGLNAIRANPNVIGHSLTGTVDQGMSGEGLTTTFRELKPGTIDAMFDAWAPLRLCLFVEPANIYRKQRVRLEAVLANEDALRPGEYPVRLQVVGPGATRVFDRQVKIKIADRGKGPEPPFALPVFADDVPIDGPSGRYRFLATFERGAAAAGGEADFYLADPAEMPEVNTEVVLWGDDPGLAKWLAEHGIRARPFTPLPSSGEGEGVRVNLPPAGKGQGVGAGKREVILVSGKAPAPGGAAAFRPLVDRIARGSTAVFLTAESLGDGKSPVRWLPLRQKGTLGGIPRWLYLSDDWAKNHPIFEGLPAGGLLDYTVYRDIIPDLAWSGQEPPAEAVAGANNVSCGYASGLTVAVYKLGAGRMVLNSLRVRENLGPDPVAERLLRNLLRYAAQGLDRPPADLPADFDAQLKAFGY